MPDALQLVADLLHLLSYVVLIRQIIHNKSVHEVSYRTQEIYLVVYTFRYGDIFWNRTSIYLTLMKITYICITLWIIYLVRYKKPYCLGYDQHTDRFNHYLYIYPAVLVVTIFVHTHSEHHPFFEFCWSFSVWLEAVALVPQIYVIYQKREVEVITGQYMLLVGSYRFFYILKWVFLLFSNGHIAHVIKLIAALIQAGVFLDFAFYYFKR